MLNMMIIGEILSHFYHSCRYLLAPLLLTGLLLGAIDYFSARWVDWLDTIQVMPYWLLAIAALIALQFNRSRLSYIASLLLLFYTLTQHGLLGHDSYQWVFIGGGIITAVFCFIKDRGLLSIHTLVRLGIIAASLLAAYLWLSLLEHYPGMAQQVRERYLPFLSANGLATLPVFLAGAVMLVKLIKDSNLVHTSLGLTFIVWLMHYYAADLQSLAVQLNMIAVFLLLTVLFDSYFLAYRDELTGLPSRRALFNLSLSLGRKYTVAMVDIDHFKKFNDTYGHDVGDQVLKLVAVKLSQVTGGGKAFRYGGEEFTIVFANKQAKQVVEHLDAVRQSIEDYDIVLRETKRKANQNSNASKNRNKKAVDKQRIVSVTVSIGLAEHLADQSFEQCMKQADKALYKAKKKGRNQVCA